MSQTKINPNHLFTAIEAEQEFGKKYFYRQRVYRLEKAGKLPSFKLKDKTCYVGRHILEAFIKDLELRIASQFPEIDTNTLRTFYDVINGKRIVIDGLFGKIITVNTEEETEEDLLTKIKNILQWIKTEYVQEYESIEAQEIQAKNENSSVEQNTLVEVLPEEIQWIKVDTGVIEGVNVKSFILVSLPSIAQFIGIRPDRLIEWLSNTTFSDFVISAHYKHLAQGTGNSVPWKKGVISGYTPLIPFEILPEVIVAFRQKERSLLYPEKANLLYNISRSTLEAVGLAISGDKEKAAQELAKVGKGLGLNVAEQIIGIFKQYESRDYQIETTKKFSSKVKQLGGDYAIYTGQMTLGITGRWPSQWKAYGASRNLPKKVTDSSREVMRKLSPNDGVGMTFGEHHFTKEPNLDEAIKTGKQGKEFYTRLKNVGLLKD